ncbi:helix-turn-helix domain-containing protein [Variovorax sp. YR216]|uniref:helix-turn-helix domain-containing protein n=1 Tax=Variovorax sp. YR216 TaxID=1882828 RepID=UPI00089CE0CC|nr:helix-turn-helix domain-containing protein [Variovorax sp. YR216]SEB06006.1 transcriptional regulator, AraC family [Variovorax sp. YR216]
MQDVCYTTLDTRDADEHAAGLSAWDQRYEQISAGRFDGHVEDLRIGPVQIFVETASRAVFQCGMPRAGSHTIGLMQPKAEGGWFCGHRLDGENMIMIASDSEFDLTAGAGMGVTGISIDTEHLVALATRLRGGEHAVLPARGPCVLDASDAVQAGLRNLVETALSLARLQPAMLQQHPAQRMLALSLSEAMLEGIAGDRREAGVRPSAAARRRILNAARDYMRAHADEPISVPDLCQATCASRRALQYAFEEILHLSPVTYLRVMRLNHVRGELLARCDDTVGDIAARWGFWHLSRFAADYRQHFGELPSATRARGAARLVSLAH